MDTKPVYFVVKFDWPPHLKTNHHRDEFSAKLWESLSYLNLQGICEQTLGTNKVSTYVQLYFTSREQATQAQLHLKHQFNLKTTEIQTKVEEDWNATWNQAFQGCVIEPYFEVLLPGKKKTTHFMSIYLTPGGGFGAGTHETTQLCLVELAKVLGTKLSQEPNIHVLDFGTGSGILAIAATKLGASVDAVDCDVSSLQNAYQNFRDNGDLNCGLYSQLSQISLNKKYQVIVANILEPILMQYADDLVKLLSPDALALILSGLLRDDVPEIQKKYLSLLSPTTKIKKAFKGDWCALTFSNF